MTRDDADFDAVVSCLLLRRSLLRLRLAPSMVGDLSLRGYASMVDQNYMNY